MMLPVSGIGLDFRLALRWLSRRRGLAVTAIVSLAFGIGANAAVFSLIDAFLFRPFPIEKSEDLVWVGSGRESDPSGVSGPDFEDLRRAQRVFTDFAALRGFGPARCAGRTNPARRGSPQRMMPSSTSDRTGRFGSRGSGLGRRRQRRERGVRGC